MEKYSQIEKIYWSVSDVSDITKESSSAIHQIIDSHTWGKYLGYIKRSGSKSMSRPLLQKDQVAKIRAIVEYKRDKHRLVSELAEKWL